MLGVQRCVILASFEDLVVGSLEDWSRRLTMDRHSPLAWRWRRGERLGIPWQAAAMVGSEWMKRQHMAPAARAASQGQFPQGLL